MKSDSESSSDLFGQPKGPFALQILMLFIDFSSCQEVVFSRKKSGLDLHVLCSPHANSKDTQQLAEDSGALGSHLAHWWELKSQVVASVFILGETVMEGKLTCSRDRICVPNAIKHFLISKCRL